MVLSLLRRGSTRALPVLVEEAFFSRAASSDEAARAMASLVGEAW